MGTEIDGVNGIIKNTTSDGDVTIKGNDGGSEISALILDMSAAGSAFFNHDIVLGDNGKATFGAGSDLQIYHDGSNSIISDTGTGSLKLLSGAGFFVRTPADADMIEAQNGGAVSLFHNAVKKFETTSTGISVTGAGTFTTTDNSDTLTLVSTDTDSAIGPNLNLYRNAGNGADADNLSTIAFAGNDDAGNATDFARITAQIDDASNGSEDVYVDFRTLVAGTETKRISLYKEVTIFNEDSIDLDFRVETNGNTHAFFVDSSIEEVMVGGNSAQSARFSVQQPVAGDQGQVITCTSTSYSGVALDIGVSRNTTNNSYFFHKCQRRGFANSFLVADSGNVTNLNNSYGAISDERLKTNIADANSQWNDIKALKVRNYKMLQDPDQTTHIGVISQELETAGMNGLINENEADEYQIAFVDDESVLKAGDKVKEVKYSVLYMKAIKALQEAQTRIETLETKVAALEG